MSYEIRTVLSNPQYPEYGQATITFPIQNQEYEHTIEILKALEIGDALKRDCRVDELESFYTALKRLEGVSLTVDELDYLAKRLDSFTAGEAAQFQGMAVKLDMSDMTDFINLTFCCQQATVITSFSDLEQIGLEHRMNLNGGCLSAEEARTLDRRKEAIQLIQNEKGTVTPYGVVYDNGMKLEPLYDGRHFPAYLYEPPLLMLAVTQTLEAEKTAVPEYLYLPTSARQLERTLLRAGIENLQDAQLCVELNELSAQVFACLDLRRDSLHDLNALCHAVQSLKPQDRMVLDAVIFFAEPESASEICRLAENLEQFDFIRGVHTPEEYGRYMIQQSARYEYDENLEGFYDYKGYGTQRIHAEGGQFNECGYVAYHGALTLEELMRKNPAEQRQQEEGLWMGGLS